MDIYGYENLQEFCSKSVQERYTAESYQEYLQRNEKQYRGEDVPSEYKISIVRKDGSIRHMEIFHKEVLWDGEPRSQSIYNDITARKQTEEALRESEQKYRAIVEHSRDLIFTLDIAEKFIYVSPSVQEMLGYDPSYLTGKSFRSFVHPDDMWVIDLAKSSNNITGHQGNGENVYRFHHASGEWRWHVSEVTRLLDSRNNFLYFIGTARDITERNKSELQIREQKALTDRILEGTPSMVVVVGQDQRVIKVN